MEMTVAILNDTTRCIACRGCQLACKQWNDLPAEDTAFSGTWTNPPNLSANTWNLLDFREVEVGDKVSWHFVRHVCMHCEDPACVSACPVKALHKTEEGPVLYNGARCIGCRYCMLACPFDIPAFQWDTPNPYIKKCTMCADRIAMGEEPACTKACPTNAIKFGGREELLTEAHARIAARPDRYVNHIYGENEAGGTSVFYLSSVPFTALGMPEVASESYPRFTWGALAKIPGVVVGLSAMLGGLTFIVQRRQRLEQEQAAQAAEQATEQDSERETEQDTAEG
jgi:formate dehydrogenase iron-sulfur subunit